MRRVVNVIKVAMVLAVMACIFYLSSQTATESRALSNGVAEQLEGYIETVTYFVPFIREGDLTHLVVGIRKVAHFTIYLVLGVVSYLALPRQWSVKKKMILVVSLCFMYAITDEVHQYFVPGRACEVRDVLIDTLGSGVGMSIGAFCEKVNVIKVAMVLAVMACIFYLSSQTATESRALSNGVAEQLEGYIETVTYFVASIREVDLTHLVVGIRKVAHFTIYLVLGLVSYLALPRQWAVKKKMILVVSLCFMYAITDEVHQYFVPGRACEVRDVLIDTLGSSVGMSIGGFCEKIKIIFTKDDKNDDE